MSNTDPTTKNRRIAGGGPPDLVPFRLSYAWGPLLLDEFSKLSHSEKQALERAKAAEQGGGEVATLQIPSASMSWRGMEEAFYFELPAEYTLPIKRNRSRGETKPWSYKPRLMAFRRMYHLVYHTPEAKTGGVNMLRLVSDCDWPAAMKFAFRKSSRGPAGWMSTESYLRFENDIVSAAAGLGFVLRSMERREREDLENLDPAAVKRVQDGDYTHLRNLAERVGVNIGVMLAAFVALYLRPQSPSILARLKGQGSAEERMGPLHDLLWAPISEYRETEAFAKYCTLLRGEIPPKPKPGPKPGKKSAAEAPNAEATSQATPTATEPAVTAGAVTTTKPTRVRRFSKEEESDI